MAPPKTKKKGGGNRAGAGVQTKVLERFPTGDFGATPNGSSGGGGGGGSGGVGPAVAATLGDIHAALREAAAAGAAGAGGPMDAALREWNAALKAAASDAHADVDPSKLPDVAGHHLSEFGTESGAETESGGGALGHHPVERYLGAGACTRPLLRSI